MILYKYIKKYHVPIGRIEPHGFGFLARRVTTTPPGPTNTTLSINYLSFPTSDDEEDTCMFTLRNEEPEEAYLLQVKTE